MSNRTLWVLFFFLLLALGLAGIAFAQPTGEDIPSQGSVFEPKDKVIKMDIPVPCTGRWGGREWIQHRGDTVRTARLCTNAHWPRTKVKRSRNR